MLLATIYMMYSYTIIDDWLLINFTTRYTDKQKVSLLNETLVNPYLLFIIILWMLYHYWTQDSAAVV